MTLPHLKPSEFKVSATKYIVIGTMMTILGLVIGAGFAVLVCTQTKMCYDWNFVIWGFFGALFGSASAALMVFQSYSKAVKSADPKH